ncbi:MAG TPA: sensor histidine kinase [Rubrobacteraceae bacterium]|nr:sensor histidine kinase [Rubrobacteraceae bacterium]
MKSEIFALRRLRWKLTFSYTLVTVVALLALELILVSVLVAFIYSPLLPRLVVQQIKDDLAPRLEKPLNESPPDIEGLRKELTFFAETSEVRGAGDNVGTGPVSVRNLSPDEGSLFVVDDKRRLLVSVPEIRGFPEGERFDAGSIPGLEPLVDRAFDGEENSSRLSSNVNGRVVTVTPIEGKNGKVAGVLVGTLRLPNLTGPLLIAVGVSAVLLMIPAAFLGALFGFVTAYGLTRRLQRLARAAQAWSRGDFSVTARDRSKDELGQLSRELNSMAAQLETLIQARGELATLETRNRFARDLHDSVKQQVFATSLQIAAARALISRDTNAAESHLSQADELVRQAQKELNVLIAEMRPAALEGKGLAGALREYVDRWSQGAEIPAEFHVQGERASPLEVEQALFRVAQEALANVAKHSGATRAEVDLIYTPETLTLRIADDGAGFDTSQSPGGGFGLQSMRERLARLGGSVSVESAPGKGTRVTGVCPLTDTAKKGGKP